MNFLMVIMASGIARGRVRTTTTTTEGVAQDCGIFVCGPLHHYAYTPNNRLTETCSLGLPFTSLILDIHVMAN